MGKKIHKNSEGNKMNIDERYANLKILHFKIKTAILKSDLNNGDFDLLVDNIQQLVIINNVKLLDEEVRYIADIYFKMEKSKDRTKQNQRLDNANRIYQEIDHANNMILKKFISGAEPQPDKVEYQCDEWQKLILKSVDNLNDREIRIQILQHPFSCNHPTCIQVAEHMKEILK